MLLEWKRRGKPTKWQSGIDVFRWSMEYEVLPGQIDLLEEYEEARNDN